MASECPMHAANVVKENASECPMHAANASSYKAPVQYDVYGRAIDPSNSACAARSSVPTHSPFGVSDARVT